MEIKPDFRQGFLKLLDYKVEGNAGIKTIREIVEEEVKDFKKINNDLDKEDFPGSGLRVIMHIVCSRGWNPRFQKPINEFKNEKFQGNWSLEYFKSDVGKSFLKSISSAKNKVDERIGKLIDELEQEGSIKAWLLKIKQGKSNIEGIGDKSRDNILRHCGHFDRAPIDIHERRFLLRTGIFYRYNPEGDPLAYNDMRRALEEFCKAELKEIFIAGEELGNSPGIVDLAIWKFCAKKKKENWTAQICYKKPAHSDCAFKNSCILYLIKKD